MSGDFESRLRAARLKAVLAGIGWKGLAWLVVIAAGVIATVALVGWLRGAPREFVRHVYGVTINATVPLSDTPGKRTRILVELDTREKVIVSLLLQQPYHPNRKVKLALNEHGTEAEKWHSYEFVAYADTSTGSGP